MKKKILLLSSIATHPPNAGHRIRLLHLMEDLIELGNEVHLVYLNGKNQPVDTDIAAMSARWSPRFYCPEFNELGNLIRREGTESLLKRRSCSIDDWYDDALNEQLATLVSKIQPDIVFSEYIMLSKCLDAIPAGPLKIIDTHDIFTNRNDILAQGDILYDEITPSFTKKDEQRALERADVILAIQPVEADFFRTLSHKEVITLGHRIRRQRTRLPNSDNKNLLFLGSQGRVNKRNLENFIDNIFPNILEMEPEAQLIVVGNVSKFVTKRPPNCRFLGYVEDLKPLMEETNVVVNADVAATGLSIKSITALGFGKPLVTTPIGARGISACSKDAFIVAETDESFVSETVGLLRDSKKAADLAQRAFQFSGEYNEQYYSALKYILQLR